MKKRAYQNLEDLLTDDSFCQWLNGRAAASDAAEWDSWLAADPNRQSLVTQAKTVLMALKHSEVELTKSEIDAEAARILHSIAEEEEPKRARLAPYWWAAAASVALVVAAGFWFFTQNNLRDTPSVLAANEVQIVDIPNVGRDTTIQFPDGSTAQLKRGGSLQYDKNFAGKQRTVTLVNGEAFFEVTKNKEKPFVVFANDIVTKVLGTSFVVRTTSTEGGTSSVVVRSGKVAVFKKADFIKPETEAKDFVLLTPNQQVSHQASVSPLVTSIVEKPILVEKPAENPEFVFDNAPVSDIFKTLERAYNVEIVADENIIKTCRMTITLGAQDALFDKLKVVCKVIGAHFEVAQTKIIVTGRGC